MNKEEYLNIVNDRIKNTKSKNILLKQINNYFNYKDSFKLPKHNYALGDNVYLKKGTLLHGTYKNIDGLKEIVENGLISSWFINGRLSKYPSSVGLWNLKQDYLLKDYIDFYSGGTIKYNGLFENNDFSNKNITEVIPYSKMNTINEIVYKNVCRIWTMEETKEARFLPSLVQNNIQIGILFNSDNKEVNELLKQDILSNNINDEDVKEFINPNYYDNFIIDRRNKDDFFTDRESALLFGIPNNFIEGILVGRLYENDEEILNEIKKMLPYAYICNLDGIVIKL